MEKRKVKNKVKYRQKTSLVIKQLKSIDTRVIDKTYAAFPDDVDTGLDLYTEISTSDDYLNLLTQYGDVKWKTLIVTFEPLVLFSSTKTDCASGYFGVRQGVFESPVAARSASAVVTLPGSIPINNHRKFTHQTSILCSNFFPFNMPNTSVSQVPKVSLYFGYVNLASTNVHNGQLRFRLIVEVRNRLDAFEHIE